VSDSACNRQLGTDAQLEVCAGGTGTDSCYGDSGGPLVVSTENGLALAGVTSWGDECGGATPGVYADVPGLAKWVKATSEGAGTTPPPADEVPTADAANEDDPDDATDLDFDDADFDDADYEAFDDADFDDADYEAFDDADVDAADEDATDGGLWLFLDADGSLWAEDHEGELWQIDNFFDDAEFADLEEAEYEDADY